MDNSGVNICYISTSILNSKDIITQCHLSVIVVVVFN